MLEIYNTLSRKKEVWPAPEKQKIIRLFVCGPTVYDYLHIGNARTYIFFDFFAKYLESLGYDVKYVQNITDIDDKIIKRAKEEHKDPKELATFFTKAYFEDMEMLGVNGGAANGIDYRPATDFITQIIAQVERLIEKGFAYKIDGDGWYFDIAKDEDYGKLSGRTAEQAEDSLTRIDESVGKKNKGDFCLWKFSTAESKNNEEPSWPARIGEGRPGWHIEDTAITENRFGPQYDIHGGGVDLKFPHHEAEIAQQESASGLKPFVKLWMHTGALLVESKKMSKSLGNFVTIRDFIKKYPPEVLRLLVLKNHYRSPMDYTDALAKEAQTNLRNVGMFVRKLEIINDGEVKKGNVVPEIPYHEALADDLNTPKAFSNLYSFISERQKSAWEMNPTMAGAYEYAIKNFFDLFSIPLPNPEIPEKVQQLATEREKSRANKQFEHSDALRKEIDALGYEVEDTPRGPFVWPKAE